MPFEDLMIAFIISTGAIVTAYIFYDIQKRKKTNEILSKVSKDQQDALKTGESISFKIDGIKEAINNVDKKIEAFAYVITQSMLIQELKRTTYGYSALRSNETAFYLPFAEDDAEEITDFVVIDLKDSQKSFEIKSVYASIPAENITIEMVKKVAQVNFSTNGGNYLIEWLGDKAYLVFSQRMYSDFFGLKPEKMIDLIAQARSVHHALSSYIDFSKTKENSPDEELYFSEANKLFEYHAERIKLLTTKGDSREAGSEKETSATAT